MKTNTKQIKLVLNIEGLKLFKTVPTFKNLLTKDQIDSLKDGINVITVNHYIYSKMLRVSGYYSEGINVIV